MVDDGYSLYDHFWDSLLLYREYELDLDGDDDDDDEVYIPCLSDGS